MSKTTQKPPRSDAAQDWSNYWQGRTATEAGAALVGVGVERDDELEAFWKDVFEGRARDQAVLDLACGAGTVLRVANALGFGNLMGLDISPQAVEALSREVPNATGVVGSADRPPFAPESFDIIASQFGVEYAELDKAAGAIPRLLRPGGLICFVMHHADGAIAAEVNAKLAEAEGLLQSEFIARAKTVFTADDASFGDAAKAFGEAQDAVIALAKGGSGLAANLYAGTQRLYERQTAYHINDILGWLDGMEAEIQAFRGRMEGMLNAALSEADVARVGKLLEAQGLAVEPTQRLALKGRMAAWVIRARR